MTKENRFPTRKSIRLPEYDYNTSGAYFITVCTKDRKRILSKVDVGTTIGRPPQVHMTTDGRIVEQAILDIPHYYPSVRVDNYVIMPNHIYLLLFLYCDDGRAMLVPTVSRVIQQLKGVVTKRIGHSIWTARFYDHVIRSEHDYRDAWLYIDNNPARRAEDESY